VKTQTFQHNQALTIAVRKVGQNLLYRLVISKEGFCAGLDGISCSRLVIDPNDFIRHMRTSRLWYG